MTVPYTGSNLEDQLKYVVDYIAEHDTGDGVTLQRQQILGLVGLVEGRPGKRLLSVLSESPLVRIDKVDKITKYYSLVAKKEVAASVQVVPDMSKLILPNVIQTGPRRYLTTISGEDLLTLWQEQTIQYNPDIQRGIKVVKDAKGNEKLKPVYSLPNVKKIAEKILTGTYHTDTIVINVLKDGQDEIIYLDNQLYIAKGEIDILDGQHRIRALERVAEIAERDGISIDLANLIFPLQVENWDAQEAQDAFYQYSLGMKVTVTRAEYFNNHNFENLIAKELLLRSDLRNKIETVRSTTDKNHVVTFSTLVSAIRVAFPNIRGEEHAREIGRYLCTYFNKLIEMIPELSDSEQRQRTKEVSLVADNLVFYGYMMVAAHIYGQSNWQELMRKLLEIDYRKDSPLWYGKITREGRKGLTVTNTRDSKEVFTKIFLDTFKSVAQIS